MNSIYDNFLTINDCKFYCNQLAQRLDLTIYDYFYDNHTQLKFPGDASLRNFDFLKSYEDWRIKFNLSKPKTIMKMGLDEYISKNHELDFYLTIKGFSFMYICKFSENNHNENNNTNQYDNQYRGSIIIEATPSALIERT